MLAALLHFGWSVESVEGSHHMLKKGRVTKAFWFHDRKELGPVALKKVAKRFGIDLKKLREQL